MIVLLVALPFLAGILAWLAGRSSPNAARWVSLVGLLAGFGVSCALGPLGLGRGAIQLDLPWIPDWGARFHLALDGLSFVLVLLTYFLGILSVATSWRGIQEQTGLFHLTLLSVLSGIIGVFLAADLFLFYFFWELMLVPMYLLIRVWGHENRARAAIKFFIFTQAGSLLMLLSILGLYIAHGRATGFYSFDYVELLRTPLSSGTALWLMLGFFVGFAVKLPAVPLHPWLPDAHTEAPAAGSVVLAGLLLKTGGYGLIRFVLPLFPLASRQLAPVAMALGVIGILYGSILAFAQDDLKRLVAYTSVSHLGFVLLGVFAGTELALQGAVVQMVCHGLSTGALFILVGAIQDRLHTREISRLGGLWAIAPRMGGMAMFFAMASLGLPGLGNFVGEFLTLLGTFQASPLFGALGCLGFVVSTMYSLRLIQAVFHGRKPEPLTGERFPDLSLRETLVMAALVMALIWIGVYPRPLLRTTADRMAEVHDGYR